MTTHQQCDKPTTDDEARQQHDDDSAMSRRQEGLRGIRHRALTLQHPARPAGFAPPNCLGATTCANARTPNERAS